MALSTAAKNAMLDELGTLITHIGLANGGTELASGGDYARIALDGEGGRPEWDPASSAVLAISASAIFDVDGGSTVNRLILRDSGTIGAGTDYGFAPLTEEVFGGDGTYELTALTITLSDPA